MHVSVGLLPREGINCDPKLSRGTKGAHTIANLVSFVLSCMLCTDDQLVNIFVIFTSYLSFNC